MNRRPLQVNPVSTGFINDLKKVKPLSKGDIVIVDTDYLYRQEQKNKKGNKDSYVFEFEKR